MKTESCKEFVDFLCDQAPQFDKEILKDWAPEDDVWIGDVELPEHEAYWHRPSWMPREVWHSIIDFRMDIAGKPINVNPWDSLFRNRIKTHLKWLNPKRFTKMRWR